jgi:hypothetical protein
MADWEVQRTTGRCAVTGRELAEGEEFYAVLFDRGETLERADYSLDAWTGPPDGAFCVWKSRVPTKETKQQLWVDNDVLANLFVRLGQAHEVEKLRFRFVLALLLMRKRLLKYEQTQFDEDQEYWQMRFVGEIANRIDGGPLHRVLNPQLSDDQIEAVSEQLSAILHGDVRDDVLAQAARSEPDPDEPASQPGAEDEHAEA